MALPTPPNNKIKFMKFQTLYEEKNWKELIEYAHDISRVFAFEKHGENVDTFQKGTAWVDLSKDFEGFGEWLLKNSYPGAILNSTNNHIELLSKGPYKQSYDHQITHARKLAHLLSSVGFECLPTGQTEKNE